MDIVGIWQVKYFENKFDSEGRVDVLEKFNNAKDEEEQHEYSEWVRMRYVITEDLKQYDGMAIPDDVPQEEIDKAVAEQGLLVKDGVILRGEPKQITVEDGEYYCETSIQGMSDEQLKEASHLKFVDDLMVVDAIFGRIYLEKL